MHLHRFLGLLFFVWVSQCCTNFLITPEASTANASMITYNTDSHTTYGYLAHYPPTDYPPNTTLEIFDWETGLPVGSIPQVSHTYGVVGNMNEFQLAIGETTFGGLEVLQSQPGANIDYGSLIYITLQRAKTAREAIKVMTDLVSEYGYASEGESFSISDPNEVWIMDFIGKGKFELGAVWVAMKLPPGMVSAHANQARITQFPLNDPENCLYAPDAISFAKNNGFVSATIPDSQFSFSDTYDPLSFGNARACEARVWSFFNKITDGMGAYLDYAQGYNLTNRMPLWVKPKQQLDLETVILYMRDHFEGTWFDFTQDDGAGPWGLPYRWRPLSWKVGQDTYINERAIATQQTAMTFVSQSRAWLPDPVGGVLWFGVDDSALTVHVPMYCQISKIPPSLEESGGGIMKFSWDSAFWVFNLVSNFVYTRYSVILPDVQTKIHTLETQYIADASVVEFKAAKLIADGQTEAAINILTSFSVDTYASLVATWLEFFQQLFVKFMDGNVKTPTSNPQQPQVDWPGYGQPTYTRVVKETGDHYKQPKTGK